MSHIFLSRPCHSYDYRVSGGELFDRIVEREQFSEAQAACVMRQLFDAISFLHELGIVHRDLKVCNMLNTPM